MKFDSNLCFIVSLTRKEIVWSHRLNNNENNVVNNQFSYVNVTPVILLKKGFNGMLKVTDNVECCLNVLTSWETSGLITYNQVSNRINLCNTDIHYNLFLDAWQQ